MPLSHSERFRRLHLLEQLREQCIEEAYSDPLIQTSLKAEAGLTDEEENLVSVEALAYLDDLIRQKREKVGPPLKAVAGVAEVLPSKRETVWIIPGFAASQLADIERLGQGLVWVSVRMMTSDLLSLLQLGSYDGAEQDLDRRIHLEPVGPLPILYDLLRLALEIHEYDVKFFSVDWRKHLEIAARQFVAKLRSTAMNSRPVHLIAHSQGALVARRAVQILGDQEAHELVGRLVLIGPANFGTFSAALALGGGHCLLPFLRRLAVEPPQGFQKVLASMTGLYQLLPWNAERVPWLYTNSLGDPGFWHGGIDDHRLAKFYGWGGHIDTEFFNNRTTMLLGDGKQGSTTGGVELRDGILEPEESRCVSGDGTVPHSCSVLAGVRTYVVEGAEHSTMTMNRELIGAVLDILADRAVSLPSCSWNFRDYLILSHRVGKSAPVHIAPLTSRTCTAELGTSPVERTGTFIVPYDPGSLKRGVRPSKQQTVEGNNADEQSTCRPQVMHSTNRDVKSLAYELILDACELLPFSFLRTGDRVGRAVVKIQCEDGAVGTGFLVSPGVLLTNHHVLPDSETAKSAYALANYELDPPGDAAGRSTVTPLRPEELFVSDTDLDFTFCGISGLDFLGTITLERSSLEISPSDYVNIIQHPRGRPKEVVLQDNRVVKATNVVVHYACDTEPGSSGSPVFNNHWTAVALHHASLVTDSVEGRRAVGGEAGVRYLNEGVRLSAIATYLELSKTGMAQDQEGRHKLQHIFHGFDPQMGFFGALGRPAHGSSAVELWEMHIRE